MHKTNRRIYVCRRELFWVRILERNCITSMDTFLKKNARARYNTLCVWRKVECTDAVLGEQLFINRYNYGKRDVMTLHASLYGGCRWLQTTILGRVRSVLVIDQRWKCKERKNNGQTDCHQIEKSMRKTDILK